MKSIGVLLLVAMVAVLLLPSSTVMAANGGDISEPYDSSVFSCCVNSYAWSFIIVRSYCSFGGVDPNAPGTLQAAIAGGMPYHDVYHFPCTSVDASTQMSDDVNAVSGLFGMLWFDIETNPSPGCGWSDQGSNCNFLGQLITAGQGLGLHMGIYASAYMWENIMGSCTVGADNGVVLWYANWDGAQSFSDFSPFGGWTSPNIKQWADYAGICGINADSDWYPD